MRSAGCVAVGLPTLAKPEAQPAQPWRMRRSAPRYGRASSAQRAPLAQDASGGTCWRKGLTAGLTALSIVIARCSMAWASRSHSFSRKQAVEDIDEFSRICVKRDFPKMLMQIRSQSAKKPSGVGSRGYQSRMRDAVLQRGFYRRAIGGYAQGRRRMLSRRWR